MFDSNPRRRVRPSDDLHTLLEQSGVVATHDLKQCTLVEDNHLVSRALSDNAAIVRAKNARGRDWRERASGCINPLQSKN